MPTITSPATQARSQLKTIIDGEFVADGSAPACLNDRLHESLGRDGTRLGLSPRRERPMPSSNVVQEIEIFFQFYGKWVDNIDPNQKVDPAKIENLAERFRRAIQAHRPTGDDQVWYFNIVDLQYPQDPTGNITRFEAVIRAFGNNSALVETTG